MNLTDDTRTVLTLDAGGTNFAFSALRGGERLVEDVVLPAEANDLEKSLANLVAGFSTVRDRIQGTPSAISFAFPGPADYPNGIIENVGNLPAYAGGVPVGPYLEEQFGVPVFLNNDGDLFAYGEAIAGLLPEVNSLLETAGSPKRFHTLLGITLGTGFGGGLVHHGRLFIGDNSNASEVWLLRNKLRSRCFAEEGASIRAVQESYSRLAGLAFDDAPEPAAIAAIADGESPGDQEAAAGAFRELGEVVGDAVANAVTMVDGLIVIGGGISKAHELFMPALLAELNGQIETYAGGTTDRIVQRAYNLESQADRREFTKGLPKELQVPGSGRKIAYDSFKRTGVGVSRLGTNRAVAIGAYAFALQKLGQNE